MSIDLRNLYLEIIKLRDSGLTYTEIHKKLKCARSKVAYAIKNKNLILNSKAILKSQPKVQKDVNKLIYKERNENTEAFFYKHRNDVNKGTATGKGLTQYGYGNFVKPTNKKLLNEWNRVKSRAMTTKDRVKLKAMYE